ncbi:MAG: CHAT domain-containing protein [Gemmatimonadales bacterium]
MVTSSTRPLHSHLGAPRAPRAEPALERTGETGRARVRSSALRGRAARPRCPAALKSALGREAASLRTLRRALRLARRLYEALVAPLEPPLVGIERLVIVPDGPLHYVPFDALPVPSASQETTYWQIGYVIDRFEITYLPSAQFLSRASTDLKGTRLLAVTRQAPGGSREVATLAAAWPRERVRVLAEDHATETAARAEAEAASVLHFAVHAQADDQDPQASHLRLAADDQNDGYLHLAEIAGAPRRARLVVLSACETQSGRLFNGEGLMGLARAFLASGAGSVVATQWPVGPSTADLMGDFYRQLVAGAPPAAALRAAKLALRNDPATAHPFYWGGFVLVAGG